MRGHRFLKVPSPTAAVAVAALALSLGGVAYGATGGNFILGQANSATSETQLTSNAATQTLGVTNTASKPAARFVGGTGAAPFSVNSGTKVAFLNADKLDGLDSTGFIKAGPCAPVAACKGSNAGGAIGVVPGNTGTIALVPGLFSVRYACPSDLTQQGVITYVNTSSATENVFADSGGDNPNYDQLTAAGTLPLPATAAGDSFVWQIQHPTAGLATIHAATANRISGNDCHFQVQAVITRP
jgi:hypothetical protein